MYILEYHLRIILASKCAIIKNQEAQTEKYDSYEISVYDHDV